MEACQACKFFMSQSQGKGECRRSPPTVLIYPTGPIVSVFPPMPADGWCGKFNPKEPMQ
jgi:hypothetical protein